MNAARLARRWFWALALVAVLAMGGFYTALGARSGPGAGVAVAGTGLVLVLATTQAVRIWLALDRMVTRPGAPEGGESPLQPSTAVTTGGRRMADVILGERASSAGAVDRQ